MEFFKGSSMSTLEKAEIKLQDWSIQQEQLEIRITLSKGINEVIREAETKARNPFIFKQALTNLLMIEQLEVQMSLVPNLGLIIASLNKYIMSEFQLLGIETETFDEDEDFNSLDKIID